MGLINTLKINSLDYLGFEALIQEKQIRPFLNTFFSAIDVYSYI